MNDIQTLYRLADGTQADPADCAPDDKGVLRHKNGLAVVLDGNGQPMTLAHETEENKAGLAAEIGGNVDETAKSGPDHPTEPTAKAGEPKPVADTQNEPR